MAVLNDGVFLVWFGGDSGLATYTASGKRIARIEIKGSVMGTGSSGPAISSVEGRGGAVALEPDSPDTDQIRVLRFSPTGRLIDEVSVFEAQFNSRAIRFVHFPGGGVGVVRSGFPLQNYDINNGSTQYQRIDVDGQLGPVSELNTSESGGTIFGDSLAITVAANKASAVTATWANQFQPGNSRAVCTIRARTIGRDGAVGPLRELVSSAAVGGSAGVKIDECPYGAAQAISGSRAAALLGMHRQLRVVRVSSSGATKTIKKFKVGRSSDRRILNYDVTEGHAVVAWADYNQRSKRASFHTVAVDAAGRVRFDQRSFKVDPAALQDVEISSAGRVWLYLQRRPNVTGGGRLLRVL